MDLRKKQCPKCFLKTLSYPQDKDWYNWKDRSKVFCRNCQTRFNVKEKKGDA